MIFYFSGTGNSQAIARDVAKFQKERCLSIAQAMKEHQFEYHLTLNEKVIFVFPIYAWAPPKLVLEFIEQLSFYKDAPSYVSVIVTCAENMGESATVLEHVLQKKGWTLHSFYTVLMPNNYLVMGRVDSKDDVRNKLQLATKSVAMINERIATLSQERQVIKGFLPKLLTYGVGASFNSFGRRIEPFYANDHCISCKVCEKICPTGCIKVEQKPEWKGECTQCLACLHYCPKSAIQYGKKMEQKARYTHPDVLWYQLNQSMEEVE